MIETYEIHPFPDGKRCRLTGPLGMIESIELDTIREAAEHAQFCAMGNEAILRLFNSDGTHKEDRPISPKRRDMTNSSIHLPWF